MSQQRNLTKNFKFPFIHRELVKLYGEDTANRITVLAEEHYTVCVQLCKDAPKGEEMHLNNTILPTVSIYKALQKIDPENAFTSAHTVMMNMCESVGAVMRGLLKLPGMKSVFFWFLPKMADKMFGTACGFQFENREASKHSLKMDMTDCPYCRYAKLFGCPELTPVFCDSDFATYGNLPGIQFRRTQTLGTGGVCCDFRFTRTQDRQKY